jgi:two-component system, sensor histidine kinase and response regulator
MKVRRINKKLGAYLEKMIGVDDDFSLENRVFNAVCIISMFVLAIFTLLNIIMLGAWQISLVFIAAFLILCYIYYMARVHSRYKSGSTIYALTAIITITSNYFFNDGIQGPTILAFFMSFQFIVATKPQKQYALWFGLHVGLIGSLMCLEHYYPNIVVHTYSSEPQRILDIWFTYIIIMSFIFFISVYIRNNYNLRRIEAEDKATAIAEQNWRIAVQNEQLERLNSEKNKLFSIISHDLKSPLDTIKGYLELLTEHDIDEEELTHIKKELLSLTGNTSDMLVNLLSWSKTQMEGAKVNLRTLNIAETLDATLEVQERLARKKDILLTHYIERDLYVMADHDMLQLVVRNLVNNAVKFTGAGGTINIKGYVFANDCQLVIEDTGQGIPEDKQKDIFSLKTSTYGTNNEKGVGLGLALCKEFIEKQSGRLWFESKEGQGTTFYVTLPLHVHEQVPA